MSWAKLSDDYHDNPKMVALGLTATGLHARAVAYCAKHETDGKVPKAWVAGQLSELKPVERRRTLQALLDNNALSENGVAYVVNDYLDYNPSKADLEARRAEAQITREWDVKRKTLFRIPGLTDAIRERDGDLCRYCAQEVNWRDRKGPNGGAYDHVSPRGDNSLENVVVACRRCNSQKGGRTPTEAGMPLLPPPAQKVSR